MRIKEIFCKHFYEEYAKERIGGFLEKGKISCGTNILVGKCFYCGKIIRIKLKYKEEK